MFAAQGTHETCVTGHGTNVDGLWLRAKAPKGLQVGSVIKFGASSRSYTVSLSSCLQHCRLTVAQRIELRASTRYQLHASVSNPLAYVIGRGHNLYMSHVSWLAVALQVTKLPKT